MSFGGNTCSNHSLPCRLLSQARATIPTESGITILKAITECIRTSNGTDRDGAPLTRDHDGREQTQA